MQDVFEELRPTDAPAEVARKRYGTDAARLAPAADVITAANIALREKQRFDAVFAVFEEAGGIARGDELGRLLEERQSGDYVCLAKAMARGEILFIAWSGTHWIPLFQFSQDLAVHKEVCSVLAELRGVYDNWEIACWFTEPNGWLDARRPVDLVRILLPSRVSQAARADRFIATS